MKKGFLGCLMLLAMPMAGSAQYPPMYGAYPQRPVAPYGYPTMGYYPMGPMMAQPMMAQPMMAQPMMAQPMMAQPMMAQPMAQPMTGQPMTQPIPGYAGPKATPAQPTQFPGSDGASSATEYPTFDANVLGAPPAPGPDPANFDDLNPRQRRPDRFWLSAAYTPVFIRKGPLSVPLVTVGSPLDERPGALGMPGTTVVFGNQDLEFNRLDGLRVGGGIWFDTEDHLGLEMHGMYLQPSRVRFNTASDATGKPVIGLPVFATNTQPGDPPGEAAFRIAALNEAAGFVNVEASTQYWDLEINARFQDFFSPVTRGSWLLGVKTARLDEYLNIDSGLKVLPNGQYSFRGDILNPNDVLALQDRFSTINHFYGLQTGGQWALDIDRFFLELHGKVAAGITHQQVRISGSTTYLAPGEPARFSQGGLLAQNSNSGTHNRYQFSLMPEAGINLGLNVLECLRLKCGYTFSVWTDVTRPGQAIDRRVDLTQVPVSPTFPGLPAGDPAPLFNFRDQLLWLHVFNLGLEFHY